MLGAEEEQQAVIEYQPAEDAVYVMLQQIQTPDGIIYDFTLPQAAAPNLSRCRRGTWPSARSDRQTSRHVRAHASGTRGTRR